MEATMSLTDDIRLLRLVARAASTDRSRPALTRVSVEDGVAAATDSYRLYWGPVDVPDGQYDARALRKLKVGSSTLPEPLEPLDFPNWRTLIPPEAGSVLVFSRDALEVLEAAGSIREPLCITPDRWSIGGWDRESPGVDWPEDAPLELWFDPSFVFDAFRVGGRVDHARGMRVQTSLRPFMFEGEKISALVMPVRPGR
jgi:hypothetical protein